MRKAPRRTNFNAVCDPIRRLWHMRNLMTVTRFGRILASWKIIPETFLGYVFGMLPKEVPRHPQSLPKATQRPPKRYPKVAQRVPKLLQRSQGTPTCSQKEPQDLPNGTQRSPKGFHNSPKRPQRPSTRIPKARGEYLRWFPPYPSSAGAGLSESSRLDPLPTFGDM